MSQLVDKATERIGAVLKNIIRPVFKRRSDEILTLAEKLDSIDNRVSFTGQALDKFSRAIDTYATHLASHTSAIQELSRSAAELRESATEQNRVLARITESLFTEKPRTEPHVHDEMVPVYRFINELENRTAETIDLKYSIQQLFRQHIRKTAGAQEASIRLNSLAVTSHAEGCVIKRPLNYRELHNSTRS